MYYPKITSCANPKIKELLNIRRRMDKCGKATFLIEGPHLIEMALNAHISLGNVFFTALFREKQEGQKILRKLCRSARKVYEVTDQVLYKVAETETPQGIIAAATVRPLCLAELRLRENPLVVVTDGIQDPGNIGTIVRTADAAGADAVITLPGTCDVYSQKAIRATAGSIFNMPVASAALDELLAWLCDHKIDLAVTAADAGNPFFEAELDKPVALVFGNEAYGIREVVRKAANIVISVPLRGKAESLNVASTAAVCLYEAVRQRSARKRPL
jgi:RNA methyltransferase, TrmH family